MPYYKPLDQCTDKEIDDEILRRKERAFQEEVVSLTFTVFDGYKNWTIEMPNAGKRFKVQELVDAFLANKSSIDIVVRKAY